MPFEGPLASLPSITRTLFPSRQFPCQTHRIVLPLPSIFSRGLSEQLSRRAIMLTSLLKLYYRPRCNRTSRSESTIRGLGPLLALPVHGGSENEQVARRYAFEDCATRTRHFRKASPRLLRRRNLSPWKEKEGGQGRRRLSRIKEDFRKRRTDLRGNLCGRCCNCFSFFATLRASRTFTREIVEERANGRRV